MKKHVLPSGITLLYEHKRGRSVSIQIMVGVGSNDEKAGQKGIAHMVEHLVFEGTNKRSRAKIIANEIESLGGDFNAYTTNWRTSYYIKVLNKHLPKAINILADILQNSIFRDEDFQRERKVVLKEIDMFFDDPKSSGWLELEKSLFKKNNCKCPSYGKKEDIKKFNRNKVYEFYKKNYIAQNLTIAISGDVSKYKQLVQKAFKEFPKGKPSKRPKVLETPLKRSFKKTRKKDYSSSYLLRGYPVVPRSHKDSYTLDIIAAILGKGQSGKLFSEIRGKRGLAYDIGIEHSAEVDFGYVVVFASASKKHLKEVQKLIQLEINKLQDSSHTTLKDLKDAKTYLEGDFLMDLDDPQKITDGLLFWQDIGQAKDMSQYIKKIKQVTLSDIKRVAKKYLRNHGTMILEGK
ncbi:insulinase family protein [archaeon]|nr:insulinase family protein [archaeon]MBT6697875.1 insulinase family protein [archaeon]